MIPEHRKAVRAVALFLVFNLIQLYVVANSTGFKVSAQDAAASTPQSSGLLSTTGNRNILANKNEVNTGATILDGMTLETPDCVAATVRWGALEEVDLGTNAVATINHSDGKIRVVLKQGCVRVRGGQTDDLTIETPDGKVTTAMQPDGPDRKMAQVCFPAEIKSEFTPSCVPPVLGATSHTGWIVLGAVGLIATVVTAILIVHGENPSPSTP